MWSKLPGAHLYGVSHNRITDSMRRTPETITIKAKKF